ncbi:hypothetical protein CBM2592_A280002 [Cupriavidus taiwanensis]|nr:hypothetical protein CBM2592_A280002 [Cupriavidus taiwanensis]SOY52742.1 hypothetical protein CBM2588_A240002 [Cupriavidus taiwanensis]SOY85554.1 hypothetical protein CBM2591_A320001 [Cupriavidus taiwanensis]SOZ80463.1 hypothetical protein CBM2618_A290001 [Cupriavidus taiwanensis]SPA15532.1 hypothetical protein CBM2631_A310001 [Cupriavidus taiwanensis]
MNHGVAADKPMLIVVVIEKEFSASPN